ncbi:MAG TPA: helix-turn-helix transcriptional regulator [Streptosporangiaceae bacterium]|nr:helix-turn-helix transcriptional regulator [Streptosporangiaceae bacterium]
MALRDPEAGASPLALFGAELRHYRTAAGLSQEQLGERIGYSAALVGAVETARRMPTEALSLRSWELAGIPGLLQTAGYARAMLRGALPDANEEQVEEQVNARLQRQEILERRDPPMLWTIMDEGTLRRRVGDAGIMREQLDHLIEVSRSPKVKVLVVPASAGAHVGLSGAFVIAEFREGPDVVYLDTAAQGQIADHPDIVKACDQVFDTLRAEALPPRASLDLIAEVRDTWT